MKTSEKNKTTVVPFALKMPNEFIITPDIVVYLPSSRKAYIYNTKTYVYRGDNQVEVPAWRVLGVNSKGLPLARRSCYSGNYDNEFTDKIDIALHLHKLTIEFSKKTMTKIVEEDPED